MYIIPNDFIHFDGAPTVERVRDLRTGFIEGEAAGRRRGKEILQESFRQLLDVAKPTYSGGMDR